MNLKLSESQKELLSLLAGMKGLPELNESEQLVLANIIYWYGTEEAQKTGYIFRANSDMIKDTEISKSSLLRAVRKLVLCKLITTERGFQTTDGKQASKYWLNNGFMEQIGFGTLTPHNDTPIDTRIDTRIDTPKNEIMTPQILREMLLKFNQLQEQVNRLDEKMDLLIDTLIDTPAKREALQAAIDTPIDTQDIDVDKEKEISTIIDTKKKTTTQQTTDTDSLIVIDSDDKSDIQFEDTQTGGSVQRVDKTTNDIFSRKKERIEGLLDRCYTCEQEEGVNSKLEALHRDFKYLEKLPISDNQRKLVDGWVKRANGIEKAKTEYFRRGRKLKQEYQAKLEAERALKAGQQSNIKPQPTAAPVNDRDKMDDDNEYTANLLFSEQEQEASREELVKNGHRVAYVQTEMFEAAAALAQEGKTDNELQEAVNEWVYWHTAVMSSVMRECITDIMLKKVLEYRQRGTAEIDIM